MKHRIGIVWISSLCFMGFTGCADVQWKPDEMHSIALPANPTTGYQWRIQGQKIPSCLELVKKDYKPDEATGGIVGVGGQEIFLFRTLEKGKGKLTFEYIRTWEPQKKPLQEKIYWIEVK